MISGLQLADDDTAIYGDFKGCRDGDVGSTGTESYRKHHFMLDVTQQPRQSVFTWPGWRLEFCWQSDRWQHILWQADATGWRRCIASTEGTPDQTWPDSPVFQNAYVERINPDCAEIQLLGQAGKNHYSGAVRCDAQQNLVDFDLAVRIHTEPPTPLLLSTYQIQHPTGLGELQKVWELTTEPLSKQPSTLAEWVAGQPSTSSILRLRMTDLTGMQAEKLRATLRWKYQWRLKPVA